MEQPDHQVLHDFAGLGSLLLAELATAPTRKDAGLSGSANAESTARFQASTGSGPHGSNLDAFLMAAGLNQILEDYLHRDASGLQRVARRMRRLSHPLGRLAAESVSWAGRCLETLRLRAFERQLARWQEELTDFVQRLADAVVAGTQSGDPLEAGKVLRAERGGVPSRLRRAVGALPQCFASFDQRPEDCRRLIESFCDRWPDRARPLAVLGVRTSGSYLAPLCASYLKAARYETVHTLTWRPGQHWLANEKGTLARVIAAGGLVLLTDDPPTTGATLSDAAKELATMGLPPRSAVPLLPVFDSPSWWPWPETLAGLDLIVLPWSEWAIHEKLSPEAVVQSLTELLVGRSVAVSLPGGGSSLVRVAAINRASRVPLRPRLGHENSRVAIRAHVRALFRVELVEEGTGRRFEHDIYAKGTGLGYFARPSLTIAQHLGEFFPECYGIRDGLLFRAWLSEEQRLSANPPPDQRRIASRVASYVVARQRALAVPEDFSRRVVGRAALWEQTADLLAPAFGRAGPLAQAFLSSRFRRLARATRPSLIDGSVGPSNWFRAGPPGTVETDSRNVLLKVHFDEGAIWAGSVHCYDAVFDLASAAVNFGNLKYDGVLNNLSSLLQEEYVAQTGEAISPERWLLYQLLQIRHERLLALGEHELNQRSHRRPGKGSHASPAQATGGPIDQGARDALGAGERRMASVFQRYVGEAWFGDLSPSRSGPICAIDIDGVLETGWLSFPAITPAGAMALRALARHGYRAVLASGRSLGEIQERCATYRLAGGVAEYGAAIYDHLSGRTRLLLGPSDEIALQRLRDVLREIDGVFLDSHYRHSVRAYRVHVGRRTGLPAETIDKALAEASVEARVRPIPGVGQTDFMVARIDKGTGLRALAEDLGANTEASGTVLALAVGDTPSDFSAFELAARSYAPANADGMVRHAASAANARVIVLKRAFQAGLFDAVSNAINHQPRACSTCRPPPLLGDAWLLARILAVQDQGRWGKIRKLIALATSTIPT